MKKIILVLNLAFTVILMMTLPTYIGIKTGHTIIGIIVAGISTLSYLLFIVVKQK